MASKATSYQGHDLQGAENRTPGQRNTWRSGKVQMVAGANDSTRQKNRGRKQGRGSRNARSNEGQPHENEGDYGRGENFEEPLDPQMHDPPAPVFDLRKMRMLAPRQPSTIKQRDRGCAQRPAMPQVAFARLASAGRASALESSRTTTAAGQQKAPTARHGPGRHIHSPDGRNRTTRHRTTYCECSAIRRSRANNHDQQSQKQDVDSQSLPLRLLLANEGADEQSCRQPSRGNPEQAKLDVPGSRYGVRQPLRKWKPIEGIPFNTVMRLTTPATSAAGSRPRRPKST